MKTITIAEFLKRPRDFKLTSDDAEILYGLDKTTKEKVRLEGKTYEFMQLILEHLGTEYNYEDESMIDFI